MSKVALAKALMAPSIYEYFGDDKLAKKAELMLEEHLNRFTKDDGEQYRYLEVSRIEKSVLEPQKKYNKSLKQDK
jgi:hypothetical protein